MHQRAGSYKILIFELSLDLGGNVRVGLEDNFYLPDGTMAKSNADLVDVAVRKIRERGQEVASLEEARALLRGVKTAANAQSLEAQCFPGIGSGALKVRRWQSNDSEFTGFGLTPLKCQKAPIES